MLKKLMGTSGGRNSENSQKLSVIIVNFQSKRYLDNCLASVFAKIKSQINIETIIVNNDENEDLSSVISRFTDVRLIDNKKNVGFGRANNLGVKFSSGEFLLLLNPDVEIISDNITEVLDEFKDNGQVGIIGGGLIDPTGKSQEWSAGTETGIFDIAKNNLGFPESKKIWQNNKKTQADWVSAAALFISRDLFNQLSGFDEKIFMYFEDMDLCKRAKKLNKKVIFFSSFKVRHHCGGSHNSLKDQKKSYYDSQEYYFKKHKNRFQYYCLKLLRVIIT